jgi:phasin family protein
LVRRVITVHLIDVLNAVPTIHKLKGNTMISNAVIAEKAVDSAKQAQAVAIQMAARSLEAVEKYIELNLQAAKANLADVAETSSDMLKIKDVSELAAAVQASAAPTAAKAQAYGRNVYALNTEVAGEFAKVAEAQIAAANKQFAAAINEMTKNAPAGTEGMVALVKSAFAASNTAFDAISKATAQAKEMVESNVEAAVKAGEAAVGTATKRRAAK